MTMIGRTIFISGGSRGIGAAIARAAGREGANVVIAAKTDSPHGKLAGTIHSAADDVAAAGGQALPVVMDVRDENGIDKAIALAVERFGGIDVCINNASAIALTTTEATEPRRFDLMHQVNVRGTLLLSRACIPYLRKSANPHILTLSPPLDLNPKWFGPHLPYSLTKFGMSLCVLGLAEELRSAGIASNALWPRTTIATAAVENVVGKDLMERSRTPEIMADAALAIINKPAREFSGRFLIDDAVLADAGMRNFRDYRIDPSKALALDLFVDPNAPLPPNVRLEPEA